MHHVGCVACKPQNTRGALQHKTKIISDAEMILEGLLGPCETHLMTGIISPFIICGFREQELFATLLL